MKDKNFGNTISYRFNHLILITALNDNLEVLLQVELRNSLTASKNCGIFYIADMVPYHWNNNRGEEVFIRRSIIVSILLLSILLISATSVFSLKEKIFLEKIGFNKKTSKSIFIFPFTKKVDYITYELDSPPSLIIDLLGNNIFTNQSPKKLINKKGIHYLKIIYFGNSNPSTPVDLIVVKFRKDKLNYSLKEIGNSKLKLVLGNNIWDKKTAGGKNLPKSTQTSAKLNYKSGKYRSEKNIGESTTLVTPMGIERESSSMISSKIRNSNREKENILGKKNESEKNEKIGKRKQKKNNFKNSSQIVEPIDYVKSIKEDDQFVVKGTNTGWRLWFENTLVDYEPLQIAQEKVNLAQLKVRKERRNLWPNITLKGSETIGTTRPGGKGEEEYEERRYGLSFEQPLTYGGELRYKLKRAMVNVDISKREYNRIRSDYLNRVKQSYYKLLSPKLDLTIYNDLLKGIRDKFKMIKNQYKKELITKEEYLRVKSILDQVYYRMRTMNEELEVAKVNFKKELNLDMDTPIEVKPRLGLEKVFVDRNKSMRIAMQKRPELDINKLIVDFRELNQEIANSREKFRISLNGFLGRKGSNFTTEPLEMDDEWQVGLQVTKPFGTSTTKTSLTTKTSPASLSQAGGSADTHRAAFEMSLMDRMNQLTQKKSKNIEYMKSLNELSEVKDVISTEVNSAYANYRKALYQIRSAKSQISKQKERVSILRSRWKAGEASFSNVLNSKLSLARKKTEYNSGLINYYVALSNLSKACGVDSFYELYELNAMAKIDTEEYMGGLDRDKDMERISDVKEKSLIGHVMALGPNKRSKFVIINLGKTDGANKGMRLNVYRNDSSVGELKIISLRENSSSCIVKNSRIKEIQLGDIVKVR